MTDYGEEVNAFSTQRSCIEDHMSYVKIVERSDEDQCYIGSCPGLFYGGCHGDNEQEVLSELCRIVEETIELYRQDGRPLPSPT